MGLVEIALGELARVDDHQPARFQRRHIGFQCRRVHRDQHVGRIARSVDLATSEIDLEGGHTEQRALRRADLRREIREGRQIVSRQRGGERELPTRQLHAVAAVARKAYDNCIGALRFDRPLGRLGRHSHLVLL